MSYCSDVLKQLKNKYPQVCNQITGVRRTETGIIVLEFDHTRTYRLYEYHKMFSCYQDQINCRIEMIFDYHQAVNKGKKT